MTHGDAAHTVEVTKLTDALRAVCGNKDIQTTGPAVMMLQFALICDNTDGLEAAQQLADAMHARLTKMLATRDNKVN